MMTGEVTVQTFMKTHNQSEFGPSIKLAAGLYCFIPDDHCRDSQIGFMHAQL